MITATRLTRPFPRILPLVHMWIRTHRTRRHLARASAEALRDVGLTGMDVTTETAKPFWRP